MLLLDKTMLNHFICCSVLAIRSGLMMNWFLNLSVLLAVSVAYVVRFFPFIFDAWVICCSMIELVLFVSFFLYS